MDLTDGQLDVVKAEGHLLVIGGPGSGKTTISIIKAAQIIESSLEPSQKILFLSFARATVSRVVEAIEYEQRIPLSIKNRIIVDTYHAFFWRILKTHGYLLGLPRKLEILTPSHEAIALSTIRSKFPNKNLSNEQKENKKKDELEEKNRLAIEEGKVCFDMFGSFVVSLIQGSERIRNLIASTYPVIILDEFQDTNHIQWEIVKALGLSSRLIALADPEQRIYDWIGADPARLTHFQENFSSVVIDLSTDNHRSAGTEIAIFGNDLLIGKFSQQEYKGIDFDCFESFQAPAMTKLVTTIYSARKRLIDANTENWSLAILVPTKKLMRLVSDTLRQPPSGMAEIPHIAAIDMDAAILGAEIISFLMHPIKNNQHFSYFIDLLCNYFQGKHGDAPTQSGLQEAENIRKAYFDFLEKKAQGKEIRKSSILVKILDTYNEVNAVVLMGNPDEDWKNIRSILESSACKRLKEIATEVRNIRILNRGSQLRQQLTEDWQDNRYSNALAIIRQAFVQEHFSRNSKPETGVVVMNMHKAKGKQFDEVIIFEGWPNYAKGEIVANPNRIVRSNLKENIDSQARQNMRVSVTRAKSRTTILTPKPDICMLLREN
ncbi:TPA: ATP-dependent helicase [Acinetobacter baumannii]|uniref:UvrD-helicase domain-containing protein n=1 Tax=Acinetobacter baumannii TaxID=470 RepID=UPI002AFA2134|nr:ATP-dependent helicase [Acinetobacter baumannii]